MLEKSVFFLWQKRIPENQNIYCPIYSEYLPNANDLFSHGNVNMEQVKFYYTYI